jgi:hypothetical protein
MGQLVQVSAFRASAIRLIKQVIDRRSHCSTEQHRDDRIGGQRQKENGGKRFRRSLAYVAVMLR